MPRAVGMDDRDGTRIWYTTFRERNRQDRRERYHSRLNVRRVRNFQVHDVFTTSHHDTTPGLSTDNRRPEDPQKFIDTAPARLLAPYAASVAPVQRRIRLDPIRMIVRAEIEID